MAEGELEDLSRERSAGIAANEENTFKWSNLSKDVQLQVLSYLPIRDLCQMRCVCKEWRDVVHRRDFRCMFDMMNSSESPSPAICYIESSYPSRLEWSSYDYAGKMWKKMSSFPCLPAQTNFLDPYNFSLNEYNLYSVGGLLCLCFWKRDKPSSPAYGVKSWLVWHPFRNKWKKLPPCKHKVINRAPLFVHVFVSDERARTYKILMAHDPKIHRWQGDYTDFDRDLVTEIYDSATGIWTEGCDYTIKYPSFALYDPSERGVLCNGVVYFVTGSNSAVGNVLFSYNISSAQWHEEDSATRYPIFEWDGRLMSITSRSSELHELSQDNKMFSVVEWDAVTRSWENTGIEVPFKVRSKFRVMNEVAIVASGNHLVITGYTWDDSFKIAVYKKAENYWRLPPTGAFSNKLKPARVEGLVLHQPRLDWRP